MGGNYSAGANTVNGGMSPIAPIYDNGGGLTTNDPYNLDYSNFNMQNQQSGGSSLFSNIGNYLGMGGKDGMSNLGGILGGAAGLYGMYIGHQAQKDNEKNNSLYRRITNEEHERTKQFRNDMSKMNFG